MLKVRLSPKLRARTPKAVVPDGGGRLPLLTWTSGLTRATWCEICFQSSYFGGFSGLSWAE